MQLPSSCWMPSLPILVTQPFIRIFTSPMLDAQTTDIDKNKYALFLNIKNLKEWSTRSGWWFLPLWGRNKTCSKPTTRDATSRITSYSPRRLSRRKRRHFHCLRQCVSLVAQEQELGCRAAMGSFNQSKFSWHHHILGKNATEIATTEHLEPRC